MYSLEIICENCKNKQRFERESSNKIIALATELEGMILTGDNYCQPCQSVIARKIIVRNMELCLVVFEKIIIPSEIIPTNHKWESNFDSPTSKDIIQNPCLPCVGTGKLQVQYKSHNKEDTFMSVLTEDCPTCGGKGYLK